MSYRLEIALVAFVATVLGITVWAANRGPAAPEIDTRASTHLAGPDGSKALYDVMVRLGHRVARRRAPLFGFAEQVREGRGGGGKGPALLVVLDPRADLEAAELEQVVTFVKEGGAVLAAGRGGGVTRCAGWRLDPRGFEDDSVWVRPRPPRPGLRIPRAARVLAPQSAEALERLRKRRVVDADDRCDTLGPVVLDTLVAATNGRPVVLRLRYAGGGSITVAADVGWFRNRVWRATDVPYVVLPLLTLERRRVVWDEYHQGFGGDGLSVSALILGWLRDSPAGWAALQLVAVGLVWLAVTAVRFGPAVSVIERRRRSPLEHLEALAAGLESASAVDTAVQLMVGGLRRRLSRASGLVTDNRQLSAWLGGIELALSSLRGRQAARSLRRVITHPGGAERVLAAANAVEDVWEELRPRTTRDES